MSDLPVIPVQLRVHLAHATVQAVADRVGADILHIKGPVANEALRTSDRPSADADILIRPSHLDQLKQGLAANGWTKVTDLRTGGLIEHSTNWYHGQLGQLDVHVRFPGIRIPAEEAFDLLWQDRSETEIAHRPCVVPSETSHRLILLLHAARSLPRHRADVEAVWGTASTEERTRIRALARELDAEVPLASAIGELKNYRHRPDYRLWRLYADGETTTAGFGRILAEAEAAPRRHDIWAVLGYASSILTHMPRRLEIRLGRRPSLSELLRAYLQFVRRGLSRSGRPAPLTDSEEE